ncbi:NAD-dependent epimerase/dehydratase family protein [Nocardioides sp.]|uniref:NAD-dependent epimerase/dehydratase family protein n=1 Tax=Nocardioides sp. TaxID=35761 RepID=UPI003D1309B1
MKLLVLGGTVFLSRAVAEAGLRRGHEVTCAARGTSGSVPPGARRLVVDRQDDDGTAFAGDWDAVVDVARLPSWVRRAVGAVPHAHWVFVSTINVYADTTTVGATPATLGLVEPVTTDQDPASGSEVYGAMKVACEQAVQAGAASSMVVRPGLIVGPGDPTGRFSYWPDRLADGGEVLAPGSPDDPVQVIDVRDLAEWIVESCEERRTGVFDGVGPVTSRAEALSEVAAGVGAAPDLTWVDQGFLTGHGVEPWAGPASLPLWLPLPEYDGLLAHDAGPSWAAGLRPRPLAETAHDTLAWLRTHGGTVTGLSRDAEADVLRAWHARQD